MSEGAPPAADAWKASLPEEIRGDASLATIADIPSLAKGYVAAQKMIGTKRLEQPQANWKPEQWDAHYKELGRPETPDKYTVPKVELPEGIKIDDKRLASAKESLHKLGLSDKQASGVLEYYFNDVKSTYATETEKRKAETLAAESALKQEWGDKYDAAVDTARSVITHFGGAEFSTWLEESGMGNNPKVIKFLKGIGDKMLEDSAGAGKDFRVSDSTKAQNEVNQLLADKEFVKAWGSRAHPGHAAAVDKMNAAQANVVRQRKE